MALVPMTVVAAAVVRAQRACHVTSIPDTAYTITDDVHHVLVDYAPGSVFGFRSATNANAIVRRVVSATTVPT